MTTVPQVGGRPFRPVHNRALSGSTRGTHFQVMSKGTNFDQEKPTNYTIIVWKPGWIRVAKHGIGARSTSQLLTISIAMV